MLCLGQAIKVLIIIIILYQQVPVTYTKYKVSQSELYQITRPYWKLQSHILTSHLANNPYYHMATCSSVSRQDESNPALWLATRAGKMELSCPLGTTRCVPRGKFLWKPYNKSFIDQACLVKVAGYWPRSFFASLWTEMESRSINRQKRKLGQYPAILTSHLVNNPYVLILQTNN